MKKSWQHKFYTLTEVTITVWLNFFLYNYYERIFFFYLTQLDFKFTYCKNLVPLVLELLAEPSNSQIELFESYQFAILIFSHVL